jgi:hypothetical protein
MSSLIAPRSELSIIDPRTGLVTREWYRYLVQLGKSLGASPTLEDDLNVQLATATADVEATALTALKASQDALASTLFQDLDKPTPPDMSLLAWWPGETK